MAQKLTATLVEDKVRELDGNLAAVARAFGVTRQAVQDFVRRRPTLQAVLNDCREAMKDDAESALYSAVKRGEAWAVCFFLKCQAHDRGYVESSMKELWAAWERVKALYAQLKAKYAREARQHGDSHNQARDERQPPRDEHHRPGGASS